jgi:hypothetical protein
MRVPQPVDHDDYLATPPELADEIIECHTMIAELPAGARVLEPSAGDGALVRAILTHNLTLQVTAIEPSSTRTRALQGDPRVIVINTTIEQFSQTLPTRFDAVVMHPPFTLDGQPTAWISHVLTAWDLLAPGGRLVAIVPNDFTFRRDNAHDHLRELITLHGGYRELPDNAFASSGTSVRAVVILADRLDFRSFDVLRELDDNDLWLAGEADEPAAFAAKVHDLSQL